MRNNSPAPWPRETLADTIWADMQERYDRGENARLEEYRTTPGWPNDDVQMVDLIYGEFMLRKRAGQHPSLQEYLDRFTSWSDHLKRQFDMDRAMDNLGGETLSITPASDDPELPEQIGKYRILTRLGQGGQGIVYRAMHPTLNKDVVIKLARSAVSESQRDSLLQEGKILARLDHPNLVPVYDLDFDHECPFLVMAYTDGHTLAHHVRLSKVLPTAAAAIVARIARGVAHAHQRGVVHRDIKPGNILIDTEGTPRLIDFGLAQRKLAWVASGQESSSLSGTLSFMAPEQARAEGPADPQSDVYSLGGVLYFLLTGHAPIETRDFASALARARDGGWDRSALEQAAIPRHLRRICEQALAYDPRARIAGAAELAARLERSPRSPRFWLLAVIPAIMIAALTAWMVWPTANPPAPMVAPPATPQPPLSLSIQVWDGERYRDLASSVPVTTGDEFRFIIASPEVDSTLFWRDASLQLHRLGRGRDTWNWPPEADRAIPIEGSAGTELIFVASRANTEITSDELRALLPQDLPPLPESSLLRVDSEQIRIVQAGRAPGATIDRDDPEGRVVKRLEEFRRSLRNRKIMVDGWAFRHRP